MVSANRTETTPEQAAVAANVITEQQLDARQYPMLFDMLREIPGLQVDAVWPARSAGRGIHARRR